MRSATCLRMIAKYYEVEYSAATLSRLCVVTHEGVSMQSISEAAGAIGLRTVCSRISLERMVSQRSFPCYSHWNQEHFVVLYGVRTKRNGKRIY
ncbi:MAG: hypothetical protein LBB85_00995 [Dysgonamonadaceae bacterium]|nr:hypothetical protein [Dysgonamonadaceae bacterium]